ncbi:MAG TPA: ABC transporter ATP-binding protein [Acholeplasmataceae bacterium]|nr:ABC transporter ATP-binding protein [Acholeplasmataceae bacterium]
MNNFKRFKILFSIMFRISPFYIFLLIFGSILTSIQVIGNVIIPKYLIDSLIALDKENILFYGILIVAFNLAFNFITKTYNRLLDVQKVYVERKIIEEMGKKIMAVEYRYLEDPYYLDLKERAIFACTNQGALVNIINAISKTGSNILTLAGLVTIMFTLSYILVLVLFVGIFITLLIGAYFKKYQQKFYRDLIPINRRYNYYFGLSIDFRLAKDLRLYNMSPLILGRVNKYNEELFAYFKKYIKKQGVSSGLQRIISVIQSGLVYLYCSLRVFLDKLGPKISIGDFTMYVNSAINFTNNFNSLLENILVIKQMLGYLEPLTEFMTLPEEKQTISSIKLEEIKSVEFRNVSFAYPKSDKLVLDNISFKFNRGEKISIVGLNGAGKTTLIKLLCRFYKPQSGKILINNINIFDYDYTSYINKIAAVFQDYKLFAYSIKDNITCNQKTHEEEVEEIIKKVGLEEKIKELPKKLDTKLNKSFDKDGVELSGGQGQKVAIARALYKNADLVILDEPTSALDPLAEADIYQNFNNLVLSKTAIYISHRMSSSVFCDKVLVIENGKISGYDTHQNLLKNKNSLYYKLFTSQAENYRLT